MSALPYCKYSNLRQGTWSAIAGTPVGDDYAIAQVGTFDPSAYVWIEETTIDLEVDLGARRADIGELDGRRVARHDDGDRRGRD